MAITANTVTSMLDQLYKDYRVASNTKKAGYAEGKGLLGSVMDMFQPGGTFEKAATAEYDRSKQKTLASQQSNLVSSGLMASSTPAALENAYETEVGNPFRLNLAAGQTDRLGGAMTNAANYESGFDLGAPTAGTLAYLTTGGFAGTQAANAMNAQQPSSGGSYGSVPSPDFSGGGGSSGGVSGSLADTLAQIFGNDTGEDSKTLVGKGTTGGTAATDETAKTSKATTSNAQSVPHTASLYSQYNRYKAGLQKQGIGTNSVADYETWYRANKGSGATNYLSGVRPTEPNRPATGYYF